MSKKNMTDCIPGDVVRLEGGNFLVLYVSNIDFFGILVEFQILAVDGRMGTISGGAESKIEFITHHDLTELLLETGWKPGRIKT